jgi:hypothetical protein
LIGEELEESAGKEQERHDARDHPSGDLCGFAGGEFVFYHDANFDQDSIYLSLITQMIPIT